MRNIKKLISMILVIIMIVVLAGCTKTKGKISYTINVYDLDGELLKKKDFKGESTDKLFDVLKANFKVDYTQSDYGPYIKSVANSICDVNYYVAIYENTKLSLVGINDIVIDNNDVFDFKVECWNTTLNTIDKDVDIFIYSFFKNHLSDVFTDTYYDIGLLQATKMMVSLGYDKKVFSSTNIPNANKYFKVFKSSYEEVNNIGDLYKGSIGCTVFNIINETIKQKINSINDESNLLNIYSIQYYLAACEKMQVKNDTYQSVKDKFFNIVKESDASDSASVALEVLSLYKNDERYQDACDSQINKLKNIVTVDGINDPWCGNNCASTACAILGIISYNVNPRSFNDVDLINVLMKYTIDGVFKNKIESTEASLMFDTPQAITALLAYKAYRDNKMPISIYAF